MELALADLQRRVETLMKQRTIAWQPVTGGYTNAQRWLTILADGSSCFVKAASDPATAAWLRAEHRVYSQVEAPFLPRFLGWEDDGEKPILLLEDLSAAHWPPPWTAGQIDAVLDVIGAIHATKFDGLISSELVAALDDQPALWRGVDEDRAPFLSLGLVTERWLTEALPVLRAAESRVSLRGEDFCHFDLRSDNICLAGDRVVVVDWNWASRGNGRLDLAFWLPSLETEGGPWPESILPDAGDLAAFVSGYFAARAGLPAIPHAPRVRDVQREQLKAALPWAVRALGLPPPY